MLDLEQLRENRRRGAYFGPADADLHLLTLAAQVKTSDDAATLLGMRFFEELKRQGEEGEVKLPNALIYNFTNTCRFVDKILVHLYFGRGVSQEDLDGIFNLVNTIPRLFVPGNGNYFPPREDLPKYFNFPPDEVLRQFPKYEDRTEFDGDHINQQLSKDEAFFLQSPAVDNEGFWFQDEPRNVCIVWPLEFVRARNVAQLDATREVGAALHSLVFEMLRGEKPLRHCSECGYVYVTSRQSQQWCSHRCGARNSQRERRTKMKLPGEAL